MMDMKQDIRKKLLRTLIDEMGGMNLEKFKPKQPEPEAEEETPVHEMDDEHNMEGDGDKGDFMNRYRRMKASMGE